MHIFQMSGIDSYLHLMPVGRTSALTQQYFGLDVVSLDPICSRT